MKVRGRNSLEQQILQGAVDGESADFFSQQPTTSPQPSNDEHNVATSYWWLHIFDVTHGCGVLHWAAGMGHFALVRYFLAAPPQQASIRDPRSYSLVVVNQPAQGNSQGRTPLHYACRNGHLNIAKYLVEEHGAEVNPVEAHHGVSPFQLAVWRNHLDICQWLVQDCGVDPGQANAFGCTAIHWLGLVPKPCLNHGDILQLAKWLSGLVEVRAQQNQGHSVLHKAAWGGHLSLCRYFREYFDMYDDSPDEAGNYAADLADMAGHTAVAQYLREECSSQTLESLQVLGLASISQRHDRQAIKRAYHKAARELHPDRIIASCATSSNQDRLGANPLGEIQTPNDLESSKDQTILQFTKLSVAYRHLMDENGVGTQCNPKHKLPLLLTATAASACSSKEVQAGDANGGVAVGDCDQQNNNTDRFAAQLTAVVAEYNDKGLDISNLRKKWKQLWPDSEFPPPNRRCQPNQSLSTTATRKKGKKTTMRQWLEENASDIVLLRKDERGIVRIYAKYPPTKSTPS